MADKDDPDFYCLRHGYHTGEVLLADKDDPDFCCLRHGYHTGEVLYVPEYDYLLEQKIFVPDCGVHPVLVLCCVLIWFLALLVFPEPELIQ